MLRLVTLIAVLLAAVGAMAQNGRQAVQLDLEGAIGPATSDYVVRGLERAEQRNAEVVILRIDTPGGLDTSMREIIRAILASSVPVVAYVAPSGAHAASAGTFLMYASHIAAMAPGTNLGAATPVQIGAPGLPGPESKPETPGGEDDQSDKGKAEDGEAEGAKPSPAAHPGLPEKAMNDASAYIRSLAELRGRNAAWAEKAVREAASLSAEAALQDNVIDLMATNVPDLLAKIDGREVTTTTGTKTLATKGLTVTTVEPDWRTTLLAVITNPSVASILMLIGIYGIILEFYSPGLVGPGVVGAICLLLALYAFHVLPVSFAGVALLLLGIALMVAEAFAPSFGILGLGGLAAFVFGSILLMETDAPGFTVDWVFIASIAFVLGGLFLALIWYLARSRREPVVAGLDRMADLVGPVVAWHGTEGSVRVRGEIWQARLDAPDAAPLAAGRAVRVVRVDGLTLIVRPDDEVGRRPEEVVRLNIS